MPDVDTQITILEETETSERRQLDVAGGVAVLYTARAPDKASVNEDTVGVLALDADTAVLAIADGAGGMPAGKKASQTAVETLLEKIAAADRYAPLTGTVLAAVEQANQAVLELLNGSATTLTIMTIEHDVVRSFQVGDSESLVTGLKGKLKLYTTPHSPTGLAVQAGYLDEHMALFHPDRHLVSNFVGMSDMAIDVGGELELSRMDTVLLASDGLTDNLYRTEIIDLVRKGGVGEAMDRLLAKAHGRMQGVENGLPGKPDDLSVILYRNHRRAARTR